MTVKWSKGRIAAVAVVVSLASAVGASYVWGPQWIRQAAVEQLSQALGRRVTLDGVEFKLLQLQLGLKGLTIYEADGQHPFVQVGQAHTQLSWASVRHLAPVVDSLQVTAPQVHLARLDSQRWNYSDIVARLAAQPAKPSTGEPARFSVNNIALTQGVVTWDDQVSHTRHEVRDLALALPFISNLPYVADQFITPQLSAKVDGSPFKLTGKTRPFAKSRDALLNIELSGLPLASYMALSPVQMGAQLEKAQLDTRLVLNFRQDDQGSSLHLQGQAALKDVSVVDEQGDALLRWSALSVKLKDSEPLLNRWTVEQLRWDQPTVWLERERDGKLALVEAFQPKKVAASADAATRPQASASAASVAASKPAATASGPAGAQTSAQAGSVQFSLAQLDIHEGRVHWLDGAVPAREAPRAQDLTDIELSLSGLGMAKGQFTDKPLPVKLAARHNDHGELLLDGLLTLPQAQQALAAQLQVGIHGVELTAAQPYVADQLNVALTRGELFCDGKLDLQLPSGQPPLIRFNGDASVRGLRSVDKTGGDDFLRWKSLSFKSLQVVYQDKPKAHPLDLGVGEIGLDDFFARIIVKSTGRLNLQDIVKTAASEAKPEAATATQAEPDPKGKLGKDMAVATGPSPHIAIGRIVMKGGRVDFSDNFIKPNYAANLTDLDGTVSALASDRSQPADLNLKGRIDHDSPLSISGKVNPLAPKLYLQLAARATDIELTRLTPYAAKYAGYPITKGKLSVDLKYLIDNGKLDAQNQVYVNQLTFGGHVDSPDAIKLPVLFAISLLTNSKGEMDVNLPISGTLSDPDFSVGGLVWRVVVNLIEKAVTAPFTMLASAFGGNTDELGYVTFAPGSTELSAEAKGKLDTMVKVLLDRPALKLELSGRVDPATEQDGAKRAYVASRVKAQKVADLVKQGQAANSEQIVVSDKEYPKYLERAYLSEPFDKPTNALGMTKSLPVAEMEKLMLQHALVDEIWFKSIADARALAVKKYLDEQGHVPVDRLFLVASKLTVDGISDKGAPQRVHFSLAH
ncbi:MAG: DUF748 domain-containing protein [Burkholderiales bacterium]|nr:DUF748 domain-containing protein [Burkholderiales bacterium]